MVAGAGRAMTQNLLAEFERFDAGLRDGTLDGLTHLECYIAAMRRSIPPGVSVDQYRYLVSAARRRIGRSDEFDPKLNDQTPTFR